MAAKIFRINYKSDFILTLNSDAGWMTPFCIKFWTGAPSQAFFVGWDGTTYTHCSYDPSEPTKLVVQFDDHHLPIGDLKLQIAYHFTVADFPNDTEDEVTNPANITTEIDGQVYQVMLDFTGETAPEIEFSLPAYANEAQRIANEQQRIAAEETRIDNETQRIQNEETRINQEQTRQDNEAQRIRNEQTRISQEEARVREFATLKHDSQEATAAANDAAALANQKAQLAADKAQLAADKAALAQDAANLANQKAQLAADKAALAQDAADLANQKAQLAQQKAEYAQAQGGYAKDQGDYAKEQGDYAKRKGDDAAAQMQQQAQAFSEAQAARQTAYEQAEGTESGSEAGDGSRWGAFKTNEAARDAKVDAKVADITNLQKAVAEGAVYDISANHLTEGVPTKYANLSAALGADGINVPVDKRKGGMSIKYIQSSDNKYVQWRLRTQNFSTNISDWYNETILINSENSDTPSDLDLVDKNSEILVRFKEGHIFTQKFNSEDASTRIQENSAAIEQRPRSESNNKNYIDFLDPNGNVGVRIPLGFDGMPHLDLPYVIVDVNGNGKYTSITQASAYEPADTIFLIMPGVYENEVVDCKNKRQYFIGVDREHVIVRNYIGDYDYPPFNIAAGLLKNMTIIAAAEEGVDVSIRSTPTIKDRGVYAVHTDWHTAKDDNFTIDNCTLISDWFAAWGIGMRGGCHMYGRNSLFVSNYGFAVGCHDNDWNIAQYDGEQYFHLIDCVLHATDGVYPALFLNSRARNDETWVRNSIYYIEMIKTLLKSEGNASPYDIGNGFPVVITPEDFLGLKNGRLIDTSWGNSESVFNS